MKKQIIFLVLCFGLLFTLSAMSQPVYNNAYSEIFLGRQPSARAEALGRSYVAMHGDIMTTFYNPAGLTSLKDVTIGASYAGPYYFFKDVSYHYLGAAYSIADYGVIAISRYQFDYGMEFVRVTSNGQYLGSSKPTESLYTGSFASEILEGLSVGLNVNLLRYESNLTGIIGEGSFETAQTIYFDLGVQERMQHVVSEKLTSELTIGAGLVNANTAKMEYQFEDRTNSDRLPVRLHLGAAYRIAHLGTSDLLNLKLVQLLALIEYHDVLNSKYYDGWNVGIELEVLEMASLRFGYYHERLDDRSISANKNELDIPTFGIGFQLPTEKMFHWVVPSFLRFDVTSLEQPSQSNKSMYDHFPNFISFSLQCGFRF